MMTRSNFEGKSATDMARTKLQYNVTIMPYFYHFTELLLSLSNLTRNIRVSYWFFGNSITNSSFHDLKLWDVLVVFRMNLHCKFHFHCTFSETWKWIYWKRWVSWSGGVAEQLASFESQKLLHNPVSAMMSTSNVSRK